MENKTKVHSWLTKLMYPIATLLPWFVAFWRINNFLGWIPIKCDEPFRYFHLGPQPRDNQSNESVDTAAKAATNFPLVKPNRSPTKTDLTIIDDCINLGQKQALPNKLA